jgi:hypothetical protein
MLRVSAEKRDWKGGRWESPNSLRPLIQEVTPQVLESDRDEVVGATRKVKAVTEEWCRAPISGFDEKSQTYPIRL